ncbi:MAG: DUF938 domain-containing protein [Thauera sp.]|jgi:SAM-dependent methyltransferase|nr:DUF938 domain-containing protein [Thauera sp.]
MNTDLRKFSPSTARNREPIFAVLQRILPATAQVLEIGSGSGEHGVHCCQQLPGIRWQPTEYHAEDLPSIAAWRTWSNLGNLAPPQVLRLEDEHWPVSAADAVVAINVLHYSPWASTAALFAGAARILSEGGIVYCYGPYRRDGEHTAPSNASFDDWLKNIDPRFGVRDLEAVVATAAAAGFALNEVIPMPANNFSLVFTKTV